MSVVIVVPTYNERDNLPILAQRIFAEVPDARLLIVDDNSPDGTGELAEELSAAQYPRLHVLHRCAKDGLGAAYVAGFRHALTTWPEAQYIVQMDADLSHDPAYLPAMLQAAQEADLVVGSRYVRGISIVNWPLSRLIISKLGTAYARLLTGLPITDCTSGFKCWRAEVLRELHLENVRANGYVFQVETSFRAWRQGYRLQDVPIVFYDRTQGESKLHLNIALEALWVVVRLGVARALTPHTALPRPPAGEPRSGPGHPQPDRLAHRPAAEESRTR